MSGRPSLNARLHERIELSDDIRHGIAQVLKRLNYGRELEHLNIAKEYINGRIGILVELDTHSRTKQHKASTTIWPHAKGGIIKGCGQFPIWVQDFHMGDLGDADDGSQDGMLVSIVKFTEAEDFVSRPTWVCREGDKELLRIGAGCFYSVTRGFVINPVRLAYREGEVSVLCTSVQPDQFPCRMVEGTSQIVGGIADHQGKVGGYFLVEVNLDSHSASLRIGAEAKRMWVSLRKRIESSLEIADVLIGPLDFLQSTCEQEGA